MSWSYFGSGTGLFIMLAVFITILAAVYVWASRSKNKTFKGVITLGAIFVALGAFVLIMSESLELSAFSGNEAAMIPKLWAYLLIPASLFLIFRTFRGYEEAPEASGRLDKVAIVLLTLVVSVLLMEYLGYFICSGVFIFACIWILGYRKLLGNLAISVSWAVFSYLVFYRLLYVSLPLGSIIKSVFKI